MKINLAQCAVEATELGWMLNGGPSAHEWQRVVITDSLFTPGWCSALLPIYKNVTGLKKKWRVLTESL